MTYTEYIWKFTEFLLRDVYILKIKNYIQVYLYLNQKITTIFFTSFSKSTFLDYI